jgi:hypothetical protein
MLVGALASGVPWLPGAHAQGQTRGQTAAGESEPAAGPDDRTGGEADRIEKRIEWFYSSRRAGTSSDVEMAARWRDAVALTRQAILVQRARRGKLGVDTGDDVWVSKGPSPSGFAGWTFGDISGRVSALAADWPGGILYVGTASGGVWKSTDDGASWTSIFDQAGTMTIGAVTVDPNDPATLWVGTGENNQGCESYFGLGLLRSTDGGSTWEQRNGTGAATLENLATFASVDVDPRDSNKLVTGGRIRGCGSGGVNGALFTSDDAGATWTKRLDNLQIHEIQRDPTIPDTLWAATQQGVYKSLDNGLTWSLQDRGQFPSSNTGRTELAIAPGDGNTVYVLFESQGLWVTTNGGQKWAQKSIGGQACDGQCSYNMVLRVDPTDPDIVVRGTVHVFRSTDGGQFWADLSNNWGSAQKVHQDTHVLLFDPGHPGTFYVGSDGGLWKTSDNGATFGNKNGNLNVTQFYAVGVHPTDPDTICGGAQDNSSLARNTASDRWELQWATGDGFVCQFDSVDPNYAYVTSYPNGGFPSVYRSTTGPFGSFFEVTNSGHGFLSGRANWVTPYLLDPQSPNVIYLGTERMYRSIDHGSSWTPIGPVNLTGPAGTIQALGINPTTPAVLFAGTTNGRVWRTLDGGDNWSEITSGLPSRTINDVAADPENPDRAFAVVGGFGTAHVWEWTAAGGWVPRDVGLPDVPANTVLMRSSRNIFVGTDVGMFRSIDHGATFEPYMEGLPQGLVVTDLRYDAALDMLTAGTYGRGAWQVTVGSVGAGVPPGTVPVTAQFELLPGGDVQATWEDACNSGVLPGQSYSVQSGDLDQLQAFGTYSHAPVGGDCARVSPSVFTPGPGNEYYVVVPNHDGREGGAGLDSAGVARPQTSLTCGPREADLCS